MTVLKGIGSVFRTIIVALAIMVILFALFCLIAQYRPAAVMSGSMEPAIHTGSLAFIDKKDTKAEVGKVIAFNRGPEQVLHKAIKVTEKGIVTKGIANNTADLGYTQPKDVFGTYKFSIPNAGYFCKWASSKQGIIVIATLCILVLLTTFIQPNPPDNKGGKKEVNSQRNNYQE